MEEEAKEIRSRVLGDFTGWTGKTVFRLENGQVWRQARTGRFVYRGEPNPVVTIRRGFMGSYRLSVEGANTQINVRRVE